MCVGVRCEGFTSKPKVFLNTHLHKTYLFSHLSTKLSPNSKLSVPLYSIKKKSQLTNNYQQFRIKIQIFPHNELFHSNKLPAYQFQHVQNFQTV